MKSKKIPGLSVNTHWPNTKDNDKNMFCVEVTHENSDAFRLLLVQYFNQKPSKREIKNAVKEAKERLERMLLKEIIGGKFMK